ncbi:MAG: crotonase/enoyl-CoA hydratase family protein [Deltaproteobacteria bacterium]|jgi:enoyl-CoA hydratase|nr:crotonase/enoyl-CoA hydratase family protein [Deltaproteobacteria bacterium]
MADEVLSEIRGQVLLITLNRPDARNAVNSPLAQSLLAAVEQLDEVKGLAAGVITGAGRGFSSGMDLKAFAEDGFPKGFAELLQRESTKPLIAAIEGFALAGGLEIALTCDLLVAARGAKLGIPETSVGLFAAGGGLMRLPRHLPYGVAMEMALTAQPILAEKAHEYGLVTRLCEPGEAVDTALELAERIARNAPLAVAVSKHMIRATQGRTEDELWDLQIPLGAKVINSKDASEGPLAFVQKRAPNWSGE